MAEGFKETKPLSRRDFLKLSGVAGMSAFLPELPTSINHAKTDIDANINFFFLWHTAEGDLKGFPEALKKCDVFIPEWIEWTPEDEKYLNNVSKGFIGISQIESDWDNPFTVEMMKGLWNTKKLVKLTDIPKGHPLVDEFYRIQAANVVDYNRPYDKYISDLAHNLQNEASWMRRREDHILNGAGNVVDELKQKDPYRQGRKINVLTAYGLAHTRMLHRAKDDADVGNKIDFRFPAKLSLHLHSTEALRRYYFAQDESNPRKVNYPSRDLLSNVVMENLLIFWLYPIAVKHFPDTASAVGWFRNVVEKANKGGSKAKEFWEIQQKMRKTQIGIRNTQLPDEMKILLKKYLEEIGIQKKYIR